MSDTDYQCGSRDYLKRARQLLDDGNLESLFYAALELRSGIEARLREYLEVAEDISEKRKQGWRIVKLGKDIEKAFKLGDKIVQLIFYADGGKTASIYHTPVRLKLRKQAQQLGDYLHAMKKYRKQDDPWWKSFKSLLDETYNGLDFATKGTLLGPLVVRPDGKSVKIHHELKIDSLADEMMLGMGQSKNNIKMDLNYLEVLPADVK